MKRLVLVVVLVVLAGIAGVVGLRTGTSVRVEDVGPGRVTVECSGWTGVSDGCGAWGEAILAEGAPSNTFEIEDVVRLRLDRPALGFAENCQAQYFLSRYPDEVAWTEDVPCLSG
jgi:hypothetical protein